MHITHIQLSELSTGQPPEKQISRNYPNNQNWQIYSQNSHWNPPTDVFETEEKVIIRMEIAGMKEDDFDIVIKKNILTIAGNRRDTIENIRVFHQMEIGFGEFFTGVEINIALDVESAEAQYENGYLIIRIDKAKPKSIKVEK